MWGIDPGRRDAIAGRLDHFIGDWCGRIGRSAGSHRIEIYGILRQMEGKRLLARVSRVPTFSSYPAAGGAEAP